MNRRGFLGLLAAGVATALSGCTDTISGWPSAATSRPRATIAPLAPIHTTVVQGAPAPPSSPTASGSLDAQATTIDRLPSSTSKQLALTVDDGVSTAVLDAYLDFMQQTGVRITFFVNGVRPSWTTLRGKLAPLVESGQAQLANHTWDHPAITKLSHDEIVEQIERNETFLLNTYGVSGRPYFRPPYGLHTPWTDYLTEQLGYPRTVMWFGSLGDASVITAEQVVANAREWFLPGRIVIGHANHPAVTHTFGQLIDIIRQRQLHTVTLHDVFTSRPG